MNVTINPSERCFFCFEYQKIDHSSCKRDCEINWLGFDKYQYLIYGIRNINQDRDDIDEKEIIMLSICQPRIDVIKRLNIPKNLPGDNSSRPLTCCTISSSGDQIAITKIDWPVSHSENKMDLNHMFYLFSIETGEMESYNLFCNFTKDYRDHYWNGHYCVYHCSSLGWLFCNSCRNVNHGDFFIYRAVFDELKKIVKLVYVTHHAFNTQTDIPRTLYKIYETLRFGEHSAQYIPNNGSHWNAYDSINVYDYKNNSWGSKKLSACLLFDSASNERKNYFSFAKTGQNMICLSYSEFAYADYRSVGAKDCPLFRLLDDQWEKMPISLKYTLDGHEQSQSVVSFCSFSLLFLDISLHLGYVEPEKTKYIALCAVINVLPLKLLAMKQIFANYKKFCEKQIIESINLPHALIRQFFGPIWRIKELFNCDESSSNSGSMVKNDEL